MIVWTAIALMNVIEDKKYGVLMHFGEPQVTKIANPTVIKENKGATT